SESPCDSVQGWEGRAAAPIRSGNPPSQETGGVSTRMRAPLARVSGQPSTPAREGEEDEMRLRISTAVFFFLLFSAIVPFLPCATCAQTPAAPHGATIKGTVYDPDGRAVPRAEVSLLNPLSAIATTETDSAGEYRFDGLRSGAFVVLANSPGFATSSAEIKLQDGETLTADLHVKLSAVQEQVVVSASLGGALA